MPVGKVSNAKVRHTPVKGKVPQSLSTLDNVCSAGAQCQQVLSSPIATQALGALQTSVASAHGSLTKKQAAATALLAAAKALGLDVGALNHAASTRRTEELSARRRVPTLRGGVLRWIRSVRAGLSHRS